MIINKKRENIVIIFSKKLEFGKVKNRIAEETSKKFAYEFAKICLVDLITKISKSDYYDLIVGVDDLNSLLWFQKNFLLDGIVINTKKIENKQEDLSNKFENIFTVLLNTYKYKKAILIPMDIPFISEEDLIASFARLNQNKFVLGPEINGGVYLIGIKGPYKKGIFKNIRWSTSNSFRDFIKNVGRINVYSLKLRSDLNLPEDILKLRDEIYHNCPLLYEFLEKNGFYLPVKNRYINFDDLSICIPVVSNLVERKKGKDIELLIQTRYKPTTDPENTGKLEIPSGLIKKYELAQDAAIRETKEETGIASVISKDQQIIDYITQKNGDIVVVYKPFCCHQQLKGGRAYISIAFISEYVGGKLCEGFRENKNPRWVSLNKIKKIIETKSTKIFSLSLAILKEYLKYRKVL